MICISLVYTYIFVFVLCIYVSILKENDKIEQESTKDNNDYITTH